MNRYVALLRGVNVGGNSLLKMSSLVEALEQADFKDVRSYIQSGNLLFASDTHDTAQLAQKIHDVIDQAFSMNVDVVVFSSTHWEEIVKQAPSWWGVDPEWKHNLLVLIPPYDMAEVIASVGQLKPDIEAMQSGNGVIYQSMSRALFGRTTTGKLASSPVYKKMTVRNYNTTMKLLALSKDAHA